MGVNIVGGQNWGRDDMGGWVCCEGHGDGSDDHVPYDDAKDHDPCPDCNPKGKGNTPGWYTPLVGPRMLCDRCDGAGWV